MKAVYCIVFGLLLAMLSAAGQRTGVVAGPLSGASTLAPALSLELALGPVTQPRLYPSLLSYFGKMGAKKVTRGALKNFIKTRIKGRLKGLVDRNLARQFAREADEILTMLDDPWWATALGFVPIVGDAFDLTRVPRQARRAFARADALEAKVQLILRMQPQKARDLIQARSKRSHSYARELENYTYAQIIKLSARGDFRAVQMKKLIEQSNRLAPKSKQRFMRKTKR